ncbi:MAG TPA: endonuclease/exonuclease/phosphatase family protein [Longimicrobiales bacterium]|nr:endonuclease/exonuclease/phosphatase family protein [Longimicrobiales bacterium]
MDTPFHRRGAILGLALATSIFAGCDALSEPLATDLATAVDVPAAVAESQVDDAEAPFLRVLTRNIYLGGDTGPLFSTNFSDIPAVLAAVNGFWNQVQATDFQDRAEALAREIAMTDPHVVALQEVARYVLLDGTLTPTGMVDFLPVLQSAMADQGLDYRLEVRQDNTTGTLPLGFDLATLRPTLLLNFTVGEATLVRSDVDVLGTDQGNYAAMISIPTPLGPVEVQRGWSRVTLNHRGVPHHVVNTHLETQGLQPFHDLQADELLGSVLAGLEGVTVVMGDLNSDAEAVEGDRSWTATYGKFTGAGFVDAWTQAVGDTGVGYTCCHDPDLMNAASGLDERIDFVLVRTPSTQGGSILPGAVHMTVLGDEEGDRLASGLWPADHAGLFAGLQLPRGFLTP